MSTAMSVTSDKNKTKSIQYTRRKRGRQKYYDLFYVRIYLFIYFLH